MNLHHYAASAGFALLAISTAMASSVTIYGRIDTGVVYNNYGGDTHKPSTVSMESGLNTASRIGIRGIEEINSDISVQFRLENRFASDTGALKGGSKGDKIFEGCSSTLA